LENDGFTCQQIRDIVCTRASFIRAGCAADHPLLLELRAARDAYVKRSGLATYLSQMLDGFATTSMRHCVLGWEDGRVVEGNVLRPIRDRARRVQDYIREKCHQDLPYVVEVHLGVGHVDVRYL
jgi:hypothetical protein